ncbi:MAG: DUF4270 domain-containing protein [Bacteroidales bacterium]|nr:DUF4270 domain-containing protein [Bacteroidales bacterium]
MRHSFYLAVLALALLGGYSCTDGESIGQSIQPGQDLVLTDTATFQLNSQTVVVDSILQKNSVAVLGEYTDACFGTTKADFMAQFYCPPAFSFPEIPDNNIDSVFLYLYFDDCFGNNASLLEASVWQLTGPLDLDQAYYTNINVADYCDRQKKLGSVTFTPATADNRWTSQYDYCVRIPLDSVFGQQFYLDSRDSVNHPGAFSDVRHFIEYFNGLYVSTTYGNGAIVYISHIELEFCYDYRLKNSSGVLVDTVSATYFPVTGEVKQVNRYTHPDLTAYLPVSADDSLNYLYAPAGMFTKITLPVGDITGRLSHKNINYARLKVSAAELDDSEWGMDPPSRLLLLREEDIHSFFAGYSLPDDLYSFSATYSTSDTCFVFDLSTYLQKLIRQADGDLGATEEFTPYDKMLLVPVTLVQNTDKTSLYLLPDYRPSAVKIRSAAHPGIPMKLELVHSDKPSLNR